MFRTILFSLTLAAGPLGVFAQTAVLGHFAGVAPTATPRSLVAEGFSCRVLEQPVNTLCVSDAHGFVELGMPVMNRQVRFNGGALVYVRAISVPVSDPMTTLGTVLGRISSAYSPTERPRFLDLVDNSQRRFFSLGRQLTLSVATAPVMYSTGQGAISMALFMPMAHQ